MLKLKYNNMFSPHLWKVVKGDRRLGPRNGRDPATSHSDKLQGIQGGYIYIILHIIHIQIYSHQPQ